MSIAPQLEEVIGNKQDSELVLSPQIDIEPTQVDKNGRQWYSDQENKYWWRDNSKEEWQLLDSEQTDAKTREAGLKENKS